MRCSTTTLVLGTLAAGQAAAHNHRHASFHARRQTEAKRDLANVDWKNVAYDLSNVNWNSVFHKDQPAAASTPTPAAVQAPKPDAYSAAAPAPELTSAAEVLAPKPTSVAAPTSEAPAVTSAAAPTPKPTDSSSPNGGGLIGDILEGVEDLCKKLGISQVGVNAKADNKMMWLGDDSAWKMEFINDGAAPVGLFCWASNGYSGMSLNKAQPAISVNLAVGASQVVSFAAGVPGACAPANDQTKLAMFGGIENTWIEFTFGNNGAFDVSREVNMNGMSIHAKGSKCTSDMDTCVFKCKDSNASSCQTDYDLFNCGSNSGGGGGYDAAMGGTGGGCAMGSDGEHVTVTFS